MKLLKKALAIFAILISTGMLLTELTSFNGIATAIWLAYDVTVIWLAIQYLRK